MIGRIISHFEILEKLGEGGMGAVYKARDTRLKRLVSLKFVSDRLIVQPGAREALVYDRSAILAGEFWRLLTGHWVHFSASHLLWDTAVLAAAVWIGVRRGYRRLTPLLLAAALAIGLGLLVLQSGLQRYGGLSGLVMAALFYVALRGLREEQPWRAVCGWVLLVSVAKIGIEVWTGEAPFARFEAGITLVPFSHAMGAAVGGFALVANALESPRVRAALANGIDNVVVTSGRRGEGWAEFAHAWLAARSAGAQPFATASPSA